MTSRAERRHPELEQRCGWCHAAPGSPCTNRHNNARPEPHPSRKDAWIAAHFDCPCCQASAGQACRADSGQPLAGVHSERAQAAAAAYAAALEEASHDVKGRPR
ncbi:zinc finger domain-containing protein [Streptomyces cylindrosporus]|uniref:DNA-binding phage zinc finger domain-containing protein n=1 Tax=Streptomyces cylindrosporus TaxID=2927583 RepID=A0ABS9YM05_9ACTN|nr:hypothetical protein [Streptomyces cylindrosporus]MCI3277571.1 hypothetical protein [Streptomyces cylindrosporus]